ncbi:MAG: hypothetical protein JW870_20855 [Candidatus Delongbacteria bacterium]|nr:hypothetical protein [Candidatus Delongbacteria bacterium]
MNSNKNILIIAKAYNSNKSARAIQMTRVINALISFTDLSITLITESNVNDIEKKKNLEVYYIKQELFSFFGKKKMFGMLLNDIIFLRKQTFINNGITIARRIIKEKNIGTIMTVSTPFDAHSIGLVIKSENPKVKWITFFSDIWPLSLAPKPYDENKFSARIKYKKAQKVIEQCEGIITPSIYTIDIIKSNFKPFAKMISVPHCIGNRSILRDKVIPGFIVHSGIISKERINEALIIAIKELAAENPNFKGLIQIGPVHKQFQKLINKHKCSNIFTLGHLPEIVANNIQSQFEIGLIIEAPMKELSPFMPSKITDIIQLNRKVVSITPSKSVLSDFSRKYKGIFCCEYTKDAIKQCIVEALTSDEIISNDSMDIFRPEIIAESYLKFINSI